MAEIKVTTHRTIRHSEDVLPETTYTVKWKPGWQHMITSDGIKIDLRDIHNPYRKLPGRKEYGP